MSTSLGWDRTISEPAPPLRRRLLRWSPLIALALLYPLVQVSLSMAGQGYSWGSVSRQAFSGFGVRTYLSLGQFIGTHKKGDVVHVAYDATAREGCLRITLSRWFDSFAYTKPINIIQSGQGEGDLIVPQDGWYTLGMRAYRKTWCQSVRQTPGLLGYEDVYDIDYRVSWRQ